MPAYVVFGDVTLRGIASLRPSSLDQLAGISGVGQKKLDTYGAEVLDVVARDGGGSGTGTGTGTGTGAGPVSGGASPAAAARGGRAAPTFGGAGAAARPTVASFEPAPDPAPFDDAGWPDEPDDPFDESVPPDDDGWR